MKSKATVPLLISLSCVWLLAITIVIGGCNGVIMNAQYSELLDRTVALSAETAERATEDKLSKQEMVQSLQIQASVWKRFQDAREGKE